MAIYITGDMHANLDKRRLDFIQNLTESDILIVLGDFGYTWTPSVLSVYEAPCTTLVVDGNHDNFTYLDSCPFKELYNSKVQVIKERVYRLLTGEIYNIEGLKFFVFGGALSIDKAWRTAYKSWWPEEIPSRTIYDKALENLTAEGWKFDYFLSHTCSEQTSTDFFKYPNKVQDPVERMISELEFNITYSNPNADYLHLFGHHHCNIATSREVCLYESVVKLDNKNFEYVLN